jgi:hypothetical protein
LSEACIDLDSIRQSDNSDRRRAVRHGSITELAAVVAPPADDSARRLPGAHMVASRRQFDDITHAVVGHPAAIIIEAVAALHARQARGGVATSVTAEAAQLSSSTLACTDTGCASRTRWGFVIDGAVAIVIEAIAALGHGLDQPFTEDSARHAPCGPARTLADVRGSAACAGAGRSIVGHSVAVVIEPVAGFRRRQCLADTHESRIDALDRAERAFTHIAPA